MAAQPTFLSPGATAARLRQCSRTGEKFRKPRHMVRVKSNVQGATAPSQRISIPSLWVAIAASFFVGDTAAAKPSTLSRELPTRAVTISMPDHLPSGSCATNIRVDAAPNLTADALQLFVIGTATIHQTSDCSDVGMASIELLRMNGTWSTALGQLAVRAGLITGDAKLGARIRGATNPATNGDDANTHGFTFDRTDGLALDLPASARIGICVNASIRFVDSVNHLAATARARSIEISSRGGELSNSNNCEAPDKATPESTGSLTITVPAGRAAQTFWIRVRATDSVNVSAVELDSRETRKAQGEFVIETATHLQLEGAPWIPAESCSAAFAVVTTDPTGRETSVRRARRILVNGLGNATMHGNPTCTDKAAPELPIAPDTSRTQFFLKTSAAATLVLSIRDFAADLESSAAPLQVGVFSAVTATAPLVHAEFVPGGASAVFDPVKMAPNPRLTTIMSTIAREVDAAMPGVQIGLPGSATASLAGVEGHAAHDATKSNLVEIDLDVIPQLSASGSCRFLAPHDFLSCDLRTGSVQFPARELSGPSVQMVTEDLQAEGPRVGVSNALPASRITVRQLTTGLAPGPDEPIARHWQSIGERVFFRGKSAAGKDKLMLVSLDPTLTAATPGTDGNTGFAPPATILQPASFTQISDTTGASGNDMVSSSAQFNGKIFLSMRRSATEPRRKLVRLDPLGTMELAVVAEVAPQLDENPQELVEFGGELYFTAEEAPGVRKLFRYTESLTGRAEGIERVAQINERNLSDEPRHLTVVGDQLYFVATIAGGARKIFSWDGLRLRRAVDIRAGLHDEPRSLLASGARLYFIALNGDGRSKLFVTEPNPLGGVITRQISNTAGDSIHDFPKGAQTIHLMGEGVVFAARNTAGASKLFAYDPGTNVVTHISVAAQGVGVDDVPEEILIDGSRVYWSALAAPGVRKLFRFNSVTGTAAQISNTRGDERRSDDPEALIRYAGKIYFRALDENGHAKLFSWDDARRQLIKVTDMRASLSEDPRPGIVVGTHLLFTAKAPGDGSLELFSLCDQALNCR